tara:strand:- start:753 stop:1184 length:432 start_codon:yes stop_codon:yes gene_type:complete
MQDHQNERPAMTIADMLAALGWHLTGMNPPEAFDARGEYRVYCSDGYWFYRLESGHCGHNYASLDAAVKSAYDARFPADPDRVEVSPLDLLRAENARLKAELEAVRNALRNGSDESVWPPGFTVADAVARLVRLHDAVAGALQ